MTGPFVFAIILLTASTAKSQTDTAGDITATAMPIMVHDSNWCSSTATMAYDVIIDHSFIGDSVKVVDTGFVNTSQVLNVLVVDRADTARAPSRPMPSAEPS